MTTINLWLIILYKASHFSFLCLHRDISYPFFTLAVKDKNDNISIFNDKAIAGSLTMTSVKIG